MSRASRAVHMEWLPATIKSITLLDYTETPSDARGWARGASAAGRWAGSQTSGGKEKAPASNRRGTGGAGGRGRGGGGKPASQAADVQWPAAINGRLLQTQPSKS